MILDLDSFTRRGLMVDCVPKRNLEGGGDKHGENSRCRIRKEVVEDRETIHRSAMVK